MLVFGQAVFLVPSPTPFPPIFLLLLNLFNMAPEIEFSAFSEDRQLRRLLQAQSARPQFLRIPIVLSHILLHRYSKKRLQHHFQRGTHPKMLRSRDLWHTLLVAPPCTLVEVTPASYGTVNCLNTVTLGSLRVRNVYC